MSLNTVSQRFPTKHVSKFLGLRNHRIRTMSSNTDKPSMLHGHAAYVAGAAKVCHLTIACPILFDDCYLDSNPSLQSVQEAIGTHISSDPSWKKSAAETKDAAVEEMRAAKAQSEGDPAKNETMGKVEEKLGGAVGCEGMVGEGKERQ